MLYRERRSWTTHEDQLLREAVEIEDPANPNPSKWHAISKHVPNRTNKDCRKRWFAKMASDVVKGGWSPEEDERLVKAIEKYGTRWSMVASMVQTRNSDQCAKRWTDTLNPTIDRTSWTPEADALLLQAVQEHGKFWTKIVKTYFPGRTGLSAKNRYNSITRFSTDSRVGRRQTSSTPMSLRVCHNPESVSSSSASASPVTPSATVSDISRPMLLTPPELALDSSSWSTFPNNSPSSSRAPEHFTYEELISALLPLQNEQKEIMPHQNFGVHPQPHITRFPFTSRQSSEFSNNAENRSGNLCQPFALGLASSHGSIDFSVRPSANPDPRNDSNTPIRGFTAAYSMASDVYTSSPHETRHSSAHTQQNSHLLSPLLLPPRATLQPTLPSNTAMRDSTLCISPQVQINQAFGLSKADTSGPKWGGETALGINGVQSHWLPSC